MCIGRGEEECPFDERAEDDKRCENCSSWARTRLRKITRGDIRFVERAA